MNHILGTLISALLVLLGFGPSVQATVSDPVEPAATYTYEAAVFDAPSDDSTSQRTPPVRNYDQATYDVADRWSHGAVVRPGAGDMPSITTHIYPGMPRVVAQAMGMTVADSVLADTDLSPLRQAEDAANSGRAVVDAGKFDDLFGNVASNAHNAARSAQNASQLARVGVYDNAAGRSLLSSHFDDVVADSSNIAKTFTNDYGTFQVRDSLFAGPGGLLKSESTWQVTDGGLRLTTAIPMGAS